MDGSTALKNRGGFGMKSQSIILLVLVSSDTSCLRFRCLSELDRCKIDEESVVGCFLRINRHVGLRGTLARLERHMEVEPR